eukprot:scaffold12612_cov36-Tisochrysis_lutea.AAC.1
MSCIPELVWLSLSRSRCWLICEHFGQREQRRSSACNGKPPPDYLPLRHAHRQLEARGSGKHQDKAAKHDCEEWGVADSPPDEPIEPPLPPNL